MGVHTDAPSRVKELREENRELIQRKREEALEACSVMERSTAQRAEEERARQGESIGARRSMGS